VSVRFREFNDSRRLLVSTSVIISFPEIKGLTCSIRGLRDSRPQTHNLKVVGSNPTPATIKSRDIKCLKAALQAAFALAPTVEALWKQEGAKIFILLRIPLPVMPAVAQASCLTRRYLKVADDPDALALESIAKAAILEQAGQYIAPKFQRGKSFLRILQVLSM
jgi:hypothetical protein